jgi:ribokinase
MGSVFVLGSINEDYVLFADRRPRAGETITGVRLLFRNGGKGANQAVAAVDSGAAVTMLARIGDDGAGYTQRDDLAGRGVDVSLVMTTPDASTGRAFVMVTPDGENSVLVAPGANGLVQPRDVRGAASLIADHSVLVAQLEVPVDAVVEAVNVCGSTTHVLLNAAPFAPLQVRCWRESTRSSSIGSRPRRWSMHRSSVLRALLRAPRCSLSTVPVPRW